MTSISQMSDVELKAALDALNKEGALNDDLIAERNELQLEQNRRARKAASIEKRQRAIAHKKAFERRRVKLETKPLDELIEDAEHCAEASNLDIEAAIAVFEEEI